MDASQLSTSASEAPFHMPVVQGAACVGGSPHLPFPAYPWQLAHEIMAAACMYRTAAKQGQHA
eukprot:363957-Chlamydomonas_euryale.AAC.1